MSKKRVAVLFGGVSSEHEVSAVSASNVIANLSDEKYEVAKVGITKNGKWLLTVAVPAEIASGEWVNHPDNQPAYLSPDRTEKALYIRKPDGTSAALLIDIVFPVLHGKNGEDGTVQGFLELAEIPFVGCGTLASAMCMDKAVTNTLLDAWGIPQCGFLHFYSREYSAKEAEIKSAIESWGYPVFVKPANAGSSVGISKVRNPEELFSAVKKAAIEDNKIVIEQGVDGIELECAVMGNSHPFTGVVGEIVPANEFYDYEAKYHSSASKTIVPAHVSEEVQKEIREIAVRAYTLMGCTGLARVDFFLENSTGRVLLNEINTLPGFTSISMYPMMFAAAGIPYPELLDRLIAYGLEREDG